MYHARSPFVERTSAVRTINLLEQACDTQGTACCVTSFSIQAGVARLVVVRMKSKPHAVAMKNIVVERIHILQSKKADYKESRALWRMDLRSEELRIPRIQAIFHCVSVPVSDLFPHRGPNVPLRFKRLPVKQLVTLATPPAQTFLRELHRHRNADCQHLSPCFCGSINLPLHDGDAVKPQSLIQEFPPAHNMK